MESGGIVSFAHTRFPSVSRLYVALYHRLPCISNHSSEVTSAELLVHFWLGVGTPSWLAFWLSAIRVTALLRRAAGDFSVKFRSLCLGSVVCRRSNATVPCIGNVCLFGERGFSQRFLCLVMEEGAKA